MLTRAQLLGQIMTNYKYSVAVSGTHGKTTTTAMLSYIMLEADVDPTISVGGIIDDIGGNIRVGSSDYFVTEACEYTNSFHAFSPYISIILNVDADHLDFFSGIEEIAESFHTFATKTPENGKVIVNGDMKYFDTVTRDLKCQVITFGEDPKNHYSAANIRFDEFGRPTYTLVIDGKILQTSHFMYSESIMYTIPCLLLLLQQNSASTSMRSKPVCFIAKVQSEDSNTRNDP